MKFRKITLLLVFVLTVFLLTGCSIGRTLDAAEDAVEHRLDRMEDKLEEAMGPTVTTDNQTPAEALSAEDAQSIALRHAGFTADQVNRLHIELDVDDRVPHYDVQFHQDRWEYEYEIHAETGEILSHEKDD